MTAAAIERKPVTSSNIASVGYDPQSKTLHVEFKNGGLYRYAGVPPQAYAELIAAKSVGRHLHEHIRGKFKHTSAE